MKMSELQKRYDVLFEMYTEHIHEHRLGVGKTCDSCIALANSEIESRLTLRALDGGTVSKNSNGEQPPSG